MLDAIRRSFKPSSRRENKRKIKKCPAPWITATRASRKRRSRVPVIVRIWNAAVLRPYNASYTSSGPAAHGEFAAQGGIGAIA
jgi:hypothetical protein